MRSSDRSIPETSCPRGGGDVFFIFCQQQYRECVERNKKNPRRLLAARVEITGSALMLQKHPRRTTSAGVPGDRRVLDYPLTLRAQVYLNVHRANYRTAE